MAQHREAIIRLSELFTMSMNQYDRRQRRGKKRANLLGGSRPWRSRNVLGMRGTRRWTKLANFRTETDFAFQSQQIASPDGRKQARISFDGSRYHVDLVWQIDDQHEPIQESFVTSDLRTLMEKKYKGTLLGSKLGIDRKKDRYFDGLEMEMMRVSNEALFDSLRRNSKIMRTNFGIEDPRTGRVYIVRGDGTIGYVSWRQQDHEPRSRGRPWKRLKRWIYRSSRNTNGRDRMFRRLGRYMGTRYFEIRDRDIPTGMVRLEGEERHGFFQDADLMGELLQACKKRMRRLITV